MNRNLLKSWGAVLAGLLTIFTITHTIDFILEKTGIMSYNFYENSLFLQLFVTIYRCAIVVLGCYLTARLAPSRPMKHTIILGSIGFVLSILGAIAMWEAGPAWYSISLIILALPCAWLGGKLYRSQATSQA